MLICKKTFPAARFLVGFGVALVFAIGIKAQGAPPTNVGPASAAQQAGPAKIIKIDALGMKRLLRPNGKPLLINFWATWCDPCREEFPDLVKIDAEYRGKIDFITISVDDIEDINTAVPKFLSDMKAEMPAYILVTPDESAAISAVAKDWTGGMPFTILYNEKGGMAYFRQGKIKPDLLKAELTKLIPATAPTGQ
jgi:thiol-disulfide isomerase/thioredoxin